MSFQIEFAGKKYKVSGTPMQPLSALVDQACSAMSSKVDPSTCTLKNGKTTLNLSDPIRFAGLARNATLYMSSTQSDAPRLGLADSQTSAPAPLSATPTPTAPSGAPTATNPANAAPQSSSPSAPSAPHPGTTGQATGPSPAAPPSGSAPAVAAATPGLPSEDQSHAEPDTRSVVSQVASLQTPSAEGTSASAGVEAVTASGQAGSVQLGRPAPPSQESLKDKALARKFAVFSQAALAASAEQAAEQEEDDSVFDITAQDVHRELAAQKKRQAYNEAGLRTKERRDREAAAKAAAIGHATIRVLLPFGMVVQCDFKPLETLEQLHAFVKHAVLKPQFCDTFSLFVTPPKRTLRGKDLNATFWDAGMVPGAYVHVAIERDILEEGMDTEQASQVHIYKQFLRSEVLAAEVAVAPSAVSERRTDNMASEQGPRRTGGDFKSTKSSKVGSSGGKVPKWLKLGK